jgi:hypothetical protein
MHDSSPLNFHRRRIATVSNAVGAWHRCPRAACRRSGGCKGTREAVARCLPEVLDSVTDSVAECLAALPGGAPRPPSRAQEVTDRLWDIQLRTGALLSRLLDEMEQKSAQVG